MKTRLMTLTLVSVLGAGWLMPGFAQIEDDIYYNPKKEAKAKTQSQQKTPYYTVYAQDGNVYYEPANNDYLQDVDAYNRFGYYPATPIDTIGAGAASVNDYQYTQYIQRFDNPTIVLDNASLLGDVLDYSNGDVNIIVNNSYPNYGGVYSSWDWPLYGSIGWNWGGWGVSLGWGSPWYRPYYGGWYGGWYDPWYSWTYPSWGWGWGWTWGPSWGWSGPGWGGPGWGWNPGWNHQWANNHWRPNGNRPNNIGGGWANQARPGYSGGAHRGSGSVSGNQTNRPGQGGYVNNGQSNYNNHRVTNTTGTAAGNRVSNNRVNGNNRVSGTAVNNNRVNGTTTNNRVSGTTVNNNRVSGSTNNRVSGSSSGNHRSSSSYTPSSSGRSYTPSGGSYGGGRSSGGSFGGGGRSSGGGGSRGGGGHR